LRNGQLFDYLERFFTRIVLGGDGLSSTVAQIGPFLGLGGLAEHLQSVAVGPEQWCRVIKNLRRIQFANLKLSQTLLVLS
jgi:hypothetical protein